MSVRDEPEGHGFALVVEAVGAPMFCLRHQHDRRRRPHDRAHPTSERGVTVVEMLVASFILAVGIAGVATIFIASAESVTVARGQADATDLATGEVEIIRSLPYENVGVSLAADGYEPLVDGRRTVTEPGINRVEPRGQATRDGVEFGIERSVTWAPIGGNPEGYKVVVVTVRWTVAAGERSVTVQTGRFDSAGRS